MSELVTKRYTIALITAFPLHKTLIPKSFPHFRYIPQAYTLNHMYQGKPHTFKSVYIYNHKSAAHLLSTHSKACPHHPIITHQQLHNITTTARKESPKTAALRSDLAPEPAPETPQPTRTRAFRHTRARERTHAACELIYGRSVGARALSPRTVSFLPPHAFSRCSADMCVCILRAAARPRCVRCGGLGVKNRRRLLCKSFQFLRGDVFLSKIHDGCRRRVDKKWTDSTAVRTLIFALGKNY